MGKSVEQLKTYYERKSTPHLVRAFNNLNIALLWETAKSEDTGKTFYFEESFRMQSYWRKTDVIEDVLIDRGLRRIALDPAVEGQPYLYQKQKVRTPRKRNKL